MATKRTAVFLTLLSVAAGANADWSQVGTSGNLTFYADHATVVKTGNKARIWYLLDFAQKQSPDYKPYLSIKSQEEFDCQEGTTRTTSKSVHGGNMATGEVLHHDDQPGPWAKIPPTRSIAAVLFGLACR